jgi:hypothetical protein
MKRDLGRRSVIQSMLAVAAGLAFRGPHATARSFFRKGEQEMSNSNTQACSKYVNAWKRRDIDAISQLIHPEIKFKSPTATTEGRDKYLAATARFLPLLVRVEVRAQFTSNEGAMVAYDFVCANPIGSCPTAELLRFKDGLVRESEIFFDARPFEAFAKAQAARKGAK